MESQAKYLLVGTTVLALVVAIVVAVSWLSETGTHRNAEYYTVYFREQTLEGLQQDSAVTMKGIKVGSAVDFEISPRNIEQVRVVLRLDENTPVKVDTRAVIKRNLLTGLAMIELIDSSQQAALLKKRPPGEKYPVIPEGRSELQKMASSVPQLVDQIHEMVREARGMVADENREALSNLLVNLERISGAFAKNDEQITELVKDLRRATRELISVGESLKEFGSSLTRLVDEVGPRLVQTLETIRAAGGTVDESADEITTSFDRALQIFTQDMHSLVENVAEMSRKLSTTVEGFEDPRELLVGPDSESLGPGEVLEK